MSWSSVPRSTATWPPASCSYDLVVNRSLQSARRTVDTLPVIPPALSGARRAAVPARRSRVLVSRVRVAVAIITLSACTGTGSAPATAARAGSPPAGTAAATAGPVSTAVAGPLLRPAAGGDGDSWRDTAGREYRLGLVNTPEVNECYGPQATARRKELVASGFRALVYAKDRYGRAVSLVTTADGTDLNVSLARGGYADDRYLGQYRHENPGLAGELDGAFAAAKRERAGLWAACPEAGR